MRKLLSVLVLAFTGFASGALAQAGPIGGSDHVVGNWRVSAYAADNSAVFSHCAMYSQYNSGIIMMFVLSANGTWRVAWGHPSWKLARNQRVDIALSIDGSAPYWVTAVADGGPVAYAELPPTVALFDRFRNGYHLTVTTQGNRYDFNLTGTYAALTDLGQCVVQYRTAGTRPANPPPMMGGAQPAATLRPSTANGLTAEERLEATTLVANLLARGELGKYRILSEREVQASERTQLAAWHVVWYADHLMGGLRIYPKGTADSASALAGRVIGADGQNCGGGQFVSGMTPDDKGRGTTRLFTACKTDKFAEETHYIIVPREEGGFYFFGTHAEYAPRDSAAPATVNHADGLLREAVFDVLKH